MNLQLLCTKLVQFLQFCVYLTHVSNNLVHHSFQCSRKKNIYLKFIINELFKLIIKENFNFIKILLSGHLKKLFDIVEFVTCRIQYVR